jgi:hypothetical protein
MCDICHCHADTLFEKLVLRNLKRDKFDGRKSIRSASQWRNQDFFFGRGGSTNSVEDRGQREWGPGGGSPLVRGFGSTCNLVQEISFHIVKFS